jgi:hypothetical protein
MTAKNGKRVLRSKKEPRNDKPALSDSNKHLVLGPRWGLTQRLLGRLTVRRNVTFSLTEFGWLSATGGTT